MPRPALPVWPVALCAPLAMYALLPGAPMLSVVALVACTSLTLQLLLASHTRRTLPLLASHLSLLVLSLTLGSLLSLVLSHRDLGALLASPADAALLALLYRFVSAAVPLAGLAAGHLLSSLLSSSPHPTSPSYSALLLPSLTFAASALAFESLGTGRAGWWVPPSISAGGWALARWVGPVGADVLVVLAGTAVAWVVAPHVGGEKKREGRAGVVDLLGGDEEEEEENDASRPGPDHAQPASCKPHKLLVLVLLVALVLPVLPAPSPPALAHPAPSDPGWTYPSLKVGCVVPPSLSSSSSLRSHRRRQRGGEAPLDEWLAETGRVASRGAKVVSWSEGAVRLSRGGDGGSEGAEGWDAMGEEERGLLRRVGEVCEMYKVYVLATYLVPPPSSPSTPSHKLLNLATLIGPRSLSPPPLPSSAPYIVWSTAKHRPVPFVESYTHAFGADPSLGAFAGALPLAKVRVPLPKDAPAPNETPLQQLAVSGGVCQDASFPSLFSAFLPPSSSPGRPAAPHLLLLPSLVPLPSLAPAQLAQSAARAAENGAFLLRCDGPEGASGLFGPREETRVLRGMGEGGGSWEAEVRIERAGGGGFARVWGGGASLLGSEGAVLLWLALGLGALAALEHGWVARGVRAARVADGVRWVRARVERLAVRESEEGMGRAGIIRDGEGVAEGRLIEVE
ncbi:hypothetical protein JCM10207_006526 [Rhodosporidiobolus poonsookiae]